MSPGVLRADVGTTVAFVNRDPYPHNLLGEGWGYGDLALDDEVMHRFDAEGTYPFTCSLHPGMVGAVVVGDGVGSGSAIDVSNVTPALSDVAARGDAGDRLVLGIAFGAVAGSTAATAALYGLADRRRRRLAHDGR